jgi:hypothetical protein
MDPNERKGWTEIITPDDLDGHMAEIGQAETNAKLILQMLREFPLTKGGKLFIPGCGTGQMFDYVKPDELGQYEYTFSDFNPSFLKRLEQRLSRFSGMRYRIVEDDIETTHVTGHYEGILTVLLLQHIEWHKGIESMLKLTPDRMYFIIQQQDMAKHAMTVERNLRPSIREFAKIANPHLVPRNELIEYLEKKDYMLLRSYDREVPDKKVMVGLVFEKRE